MGSHNTFTSNAGNLVGDGWDGPSATSWNTPSATSWDTPAPVNWDTPLPNNNQQNTLAMPPEKPKLSERFGGALKKIREKFSGSMNRGGGAWREAVASPEIGGAALDTFQTAGMAALRGVGVIGRNGEVSVAGTVRAVWGLKTPGGILKTARKAALGVARDPNVRSSAANLGGHVANHVGNASPQFAGAYGSVQKAMENPFVNAGARFVGNHVQAKVGNSVNRAIDNW